MDKCLSLVINSRKLYKNYLSMFEPIMLKYQLTRGELEVLIFLSLKSGSCNSRQVCDYWAIEKAVVSRALESLFEKGYIAIVPSPDDKRLLRFQTDGAANEIVEAIRVERESLNAKLFSGISENELDIFSKLFTKICGNAVKISS